jgi:hypothetical protein
LPGELFISRIKPYIFRPAFVLICAILVTLVLAIGVVIVFSGERERHLLTYDVPIAIPFIVFVFDRLKLLHSMSFRERAIDAVVLIFAIARAFVLIPIISGHTLFLTYAILTGRSSLARAAAFVVLLEVAYLKLFVWHDLTFVGGLGFGILAAIIWRGVRRNSQLAQVTTSN